MKKSILAVAALALLCGGAGSFTHESSLAAKTRKTTKTKHRGKTSNASLNSIFQSSVGKYPYEINLLKKPVLKARLVKLLGQSRYNTMARYFQTQTPVEFSNWNYYTMGGEQHNMGSTFFEISYNPGADALAVKYVIEGNVRIFAEKRNVNYYWDY